MMQIETKIKNKKISKKLEKHRLKYADIREKLESAKLKLEWKVVDQAITDLVENQDLIENTFRDAIVSHILNKLDENGLLKS